MAKANERVFQGKLLSIINKFCSENREIGFSQITQEENVGIPQGLNLQITNYIHLLIQIK